MKYEMWQAAGGLWYWHLKASNNEIIAQGQGYSIRQECLDAVNLVMNTTHGTPFVELPSQARPQQPGAYS